MRIASIRLEGYRNFRDSFININDKSLIIGANDVGKTNLIYALRLLLDRSLPESALDPSDSDFYVHAPTDFLRIDVHLVDVVEDCLVSKFKQYLADESDLHLIYEASRDPASGKKSYEIKAGPADAPETLSNRFYLRYLNLRVIEGKRDLLRFIRKERRFLLEDAKASRSQEQIDSDAQVLKEVEERLREVNDTIAKLHYINTATGRLNVELAKLSHKHEGQEVVFGTTTASPAAFVDNVELVTRLAGGTLGTGGDGRHNQIQLALWATRNQINAGDQADPEEVSIYCIEEPEAHLHPHQQRKLAAYLADALTSQVILTSHSPQIASEFLPSSLIRLYEKNGETVAAAAGCSELVNTEAVRFGYRMSILPAEAFFATAVLLVEGPSELLFYRALARALAVDIDRLNLSILSVDGVGFEVYCSLLSALAIPFVLRTDNDVFRVPRSGTRRYAGVQRALKIAFTHQRLHPTDVHNAHLLEGFSEDGPIPEPSISAAEGIRKMLQEHGIYVAAADLEKDVSAALGDLLLEYTGAADSEAAVSKMKQAKATFMFDFLRQNADALVALADSDLAKPLFHCQEIVRGVSDR